MVGYIRPYKPELKMKDFEIYRAVYCGLCHTLSKRYSFLMRMILSYDITFLAILQLALNNDCFGFEKRRCPVRLKKRACCTITGDVEFSADVGVILFFYKLHDNLHDAGFIKKMAALVLMPLAKHMHKKAKKLRPEADAIIASYISEQAKVEQKQAHIDEAANPSGEMMAKLLKLHAGSDSEGRILERMGYFIGRWVYLTDAVNDLKADLETGDFNSFIHTYSLKEGSDLSVINETAKGLLNSCMTEIATAFELLEIKRFRPVIENIVYFGLKMTSESILKDEKLSPV